MASLTHTVPATNKNFFNFIVSLEFNVQNLVLEPYAVGFVNTKEHIFSNNFNNA